jgi:hypothetical protein
VFEVHDCFAEVLHSSVDRKGHRSSPTVKRLKIVRIQFQGLIACSDSRLIVLGLDVACGYVKVEAKLELAELSPLELVPSLFFKLLNLIIINALILPFWVVTNMVPKNA